MLSAYLALKISWELFEKAPDLLSSAERQRLDEIARRQEKIEHRILSTLEAAAIIIPADTLKQRFEEIRRRYPSEEEFERDMAAIHLDEVTLKQAIERDLRVESVLERVASAVSAITDVDAEIYYRLHPDAFDRPEARRLRHILMTYSSAVEKVCIHEQLSKLGQTLKSADDFARAALKHSQCPTAMDGGMLGVVKRQQLYEQLEPVAFSLKSNEISPVLESPIGLHLIRCDEIFPSGMLPFHEVRERIIEKLIDKRGREAQRAWIRGLAGKGG